ncbi:MAG: PilZ domain-containing protein [Candidatus Omnitrophota bacterium]|jgi:uncharacterized protein (TIGR02266 family)
MPIGIREISGISILDIEGNIDINSSDIIETVGWLLNSGKLNMILNLECVGLVDYNGLSVLTIAFKNTVNHKGALKFLGVTLSVRELFRIVKLDSVFETFSDEKACVASFFDESAQKLHLRRKFKRLDLHLPIQYKISGQANAKFFTGNILNLSAVGVYIYTPYIFPLNTMLDLQFTFPDTHAPLEAEANVVWLADKQLQSHVSPGMGAGFVHLTAEKEKAIIDFIDKNITYRSEQ